MDNLNAGASVTSIREVTGVAAKRMRKGHAKAVHGDDPVGRWLALAPAFLFLLCLSVLPILNLVLVSFYKVSWVDAKAVWNFVGTQHYSSLFADKLFGASVTNTMIFAASSTLSQVAIGLALAIFVSRIERGRVIYRMIFILPLLIPGIVIGAMWKLLLNGEFGLLNQLLGILGVWPIDWLGDPRLALMSVVMVDVWHWTPFCFLLLLAGVESLPQDIYEQAKVDGATPWQEFTRITLPLMVPTIVVTFVFRLIVAFKVFDEIYLLTGGGPGTATEVLSFTIYQRFFTENNAGYGAAMSIAAIFLVCMLLSVALSARRLAGSRP